MKYFDGAICMTVGQQQVSKLGILFLSFDHEMLVM
jgi:hypothetical protein